MADPEPLMTAEVSVSKDDYEYEKRTYSLEEVRSSASR
jgi:hypothetical protein